MDLESVEVPEGWHPDFVRAMFLCRSCGFQDIYFYDVAHDRRVERPYCPMKKCRERACQ